MLRGTRISTKFALVGVILSICMGGSETISFLVEVFVWSFSFSFSTNWASLGYDGAFFKGSRRFSSVGWWRVEMGFSAASSTY